MTKEIHGWRLVMTDGEKETSTLPIGDEDIAGLTVETFQTLKLSFGSFGFRIVLGENGVVWMRDFGVIGKLKIGVKGVLPCSARRCGLSEFASKGDSGARLSEVL